MSKKVLIQSCYKFFPLPEANLFALQARLEKKAKDLSVLGLVILGHEGINTTFCGRESDSREFLEFLESSLKTGFEVKESWSDRPPFHEFKVKLRDEIVTLGTPDLVPEKSKDRHLSPEDWEKALQGEDVVVLDTRNAYETEVGMFKGAIDPKISEFTEFPEYLKKSDLKKDKKILIYCTGGIRCEKAILEMDRQGYENVYQLDGGILNYLEKFPEKSWDGECFVFDYRVAVDQGLEPTKKYRLCPHCGDPGDQPTECPQCQNMEVICTKCLAKGDEYKTCSKNCAHHLRMGHRARKKHEDAFIKRGHYHGN